VSVKILKTAAKPAKLKLVADRKILKANGQDLSYVTVKLVDANGASDPKAEELIKFSVQGAATIVGVANGNPKSLESFQASERKLWQGKGLVILKTNGVAGQITLTASAPGFPETQLLLTSLK
jgi:beta-galactosidase